MDEMEMPCSVGSHYEVETTLTPLHVVLTGERRKGMAEEKRQHLKTQTCTALPVPDCRKVRWRAGLEWKGEGTDKRRQEKNKEKIGRVADMKTKRHPRNFLGGEQHYPRFAAVGC